jgi:hypothetical protein
MSTARKILASGILLGTCLLSPALPGCGSGGQETGPGGEVKLIGPVNPKGDSAPVSEEYKNLDPGGKVKK